MASRPRPSPSLGRGDSRSLSGGHSCITLIMSSPGRMFRTMQAGSLEALWITRPQAVGLERTTKDWEVRGHVRASVDGACQIILASDVRKAHERTGLRIRPACHRGRSTSPRRADRVTEPLERVAHVPSLVKSCGIRCADRSNAVRNTLISKIFRQGPHSGPFKSGVQPPLWAREPNESYFRNFRNFRPSRSKNHFCLDARTPGCYFVRWLLLAKGNRSWLREPRRAHDRVAGAFFLATAVRWTDRSDCPADDPASR